MEIFKMKYRFSNSTIFLCMFNENIVYRHLPFEEYFECLHLHYINANV